MNWSRMKLGRLFWKFFFFFWLAQLVTSVGVGISIWLLRPEIHWELPEPPGEGRPPDNFPGMGGPPPQADMAGAVAGPPAPRPGPPRQRSLLPPLMPILAGSIVSLLFAALLAWYFARPIRNLRAAFEAVAGGRLETRIGDTMGRRRDELSDLGTDFDRMAERLQGLLDGQRRLLHDVSHELRSPLARLQAAADLMRQQPERGADFIERIERDTARMDRLVGELLTLARLDSGMAGKLDQDFDLGEMIHDIADDARIEADPKACRIATALASPLPVRGNPELLHRAIENVVRNAVRHSPRGGLISIEGQADAETHTLRIGIADAGPGVPDTNLEAIFAPFFRGEGTGAGYGLGLAITRRVVAAHGGSVNAANRTQGGLRVTIRLPAYSTAT